MQVCVKPATYDHVETNNLASNLTVSTNEMKPIRSVTRTILQAPANQTIADASVSAARLSRSSTSIKVFQPCPALNDMDDYLTTGTDELKRVGYKVEEEVVDDEVTAFTAADVDVAGVPEARRSIR
jgi:hypothetical protein